jgi:adenylate cyclase class 2
MKDRELEIKFFTANFETLEKRVLELGGILVQPRTHEYNLRFDTRNGELSEAMSVLRLRKDAGIHLTFKGPSETLGGVLARKEIEFDVSDFEAAQKFIEALGFRSKFVYEKYRTTYDVDGVKITLDEMPYGNFVEIEGPDAASIQNMSKQLNFDWDERLPESYIGIFRRIKELANLNFKDLTFDNFKDQSVDLGRVGVKSADR